MFDLALLMRKKFYSIYGSLLFFLLLLISLFGNAQTTVNFSASGTFVVPCNVTSIQVECWGGGGGSGGGTNTGQPGGSGGGGGAYARSTFAVTPGQSFVYSVGLGGTAGPVGGGPAGGGGNTNFNAGAVIAVGGTGGFADGGPAGTGGFSGSCVGTFKFSGGNGFAQIGGTAGGGGGGAGGSASNGGMAAGQPGGIGGFSGGGTGGNGQAIGGTGVPGMAPGGGAGGSGQRSGGSEAGGPGANGQVSITYTQLPLAGGTYSIGPAGTYTTVTASIAAMQCAGITGPVIFELQSTYTDASETYPLAFGVIAGVSNINTVTYRPASGATNLVCDGDPGSTNSLVSFTGTNYLTFDGRAGGAGIGQWTLRNTRTSATVGNTVTFINDASNNKLTYLNIEGQPASTNAVVLFAGSTGTTGNDNNTVSFCTLQDLTAGGTGVFPCTGVYSAGTAGKSNNGNLIDNNRFVDIYNPTGAISSGIELALNNDAWTITNNHFYQGGANYSALNTNPWSGIYINGGGGYTVTGNFIGGRASNCGGGAFTVTSGTSQLNGIRFVTASGACTVSGNTFANINYTTTASTAPYPMAAISLVGSASYICGSVGNGNTIGSMSSLNSLVATNNGASTSAGFTGIFYDGTGSCSIAYNNFGGIRQQGTLADADLDLISLNINSGTLTVNNNTIGSALANSIECASNSPFTAIFNGGNTAGLSCTNNTFQNLTLSGAGTSNLYGVLNFAGPLTLTGNTFNKFSSSHNGICEMVRHNGGTTANIDGNTFQDFTLSNTGGFAILYGIDLNTASAVVINANTFGSSSPANILINGNDDNFVIYKTGTGSLTMTNNTIQNIAFGTGGAATGFQAVLCGQGAFTCTGNTIKDITVNTTSPSDFAAIWSSTASAGVFISNNIIKNISYTNAAAVATLNRGMYVENGSGSITKNSITELSNASASASARIVAAEIFNGSWDLFNNVVLLNNNASANSVILYGFAIPSINTIRIYHNTVKIYGSQGGNSLSAASFRTGANIFTIKNNLFQNLRTGGTGGHYTEYVNPTTGTYTSDYNYLEASDPSKLCNYGGVNKTLATWKASTSANNSISGTTTVDATGQVTSDPFLGAGTGANLLATVTDDKNNVARCIAPWMGAMEGPDITTASISPLTYCAGAAVSVSFTAGGSTAFDAGNVFTAQLSDAAGSFTLSPTPIGTLASTTSGTIAAVIPGPTPLGTGYRIRVVSSDPVVTGSDNGADITVSNGLASPPVAIAASALTCSGFTANWNASAGGTAYRLDVATDPGITAFVPGYNDLGVGAVTSYAVTGLLSGTNYYYRVRAENGCGISGNSNVIGPVLTSGTPGIYVVLNTGNTGAGSLRQAILDANANCGHDLIRFQLGGGGPFTIALTSALPTLSDIGGAGVTIDGWDNFGNPGTPNTIPVFNATAGSPMNPAYKIIITNTATNGGINIADSYNIIRGLAFYNIGGGASASTDIAINIISGSNNYILGNYVGMNVSGTTKGGVNTDIGIQISGSNNFIGDGTAAGANLISGMNGNLSGIRFVGAGATGNSIKGNMIGLQKDGVNTVVGSNQEDGITFPFASGGSNIVGGTGAGEGNVISGNIYGINMASTNATGNTVAGNIIGPQSNGTMLVSGTLQVDGIFMVSTNNNIIGGNTAGARNIISGNSTEGIWMSGAGTTGNTIKGNYIGIDKNGTTSIAGSTQDYGIQMIASCGGTNIIGGSGAGEGNVISGNTSQGIRLLSTAGAGNSILGNIIGPQADGNTYLAANPQSIGLFIQSSPNNTVGGNSAGARNILSANESTGLYLTGAGTTGNSIKGNYMGLPQNGSTFITGSTQETGVYITLSAASNTIGGAGSGEGNVISGNVNSGISANSTAVAGNVILGNIIGPQADGLTFVASNAQVYGININDSPNNTIGGNSAGARNIISANNTYGIQIFGAVCTGNTVKGNYIGINKNGTGIIAGSTQDNGILITSSAAFNTIGGAWTGEGNVISGNANAGTSGRGIYLTSTAAGGNTVLGNIIGPQANGITYLGSNGQWIGIEISSSLNNTIGGNTPEARNIISANEAAGIALYGASSTGNVIKGNYIGIDQTGTAFITNSTQDYGVSIHTSATNNTVGGNGAGDGNVISGNKNGTSTGIGVFLNNASANTIAGNTIGPQADGITYLASNAQNSGIEMNNSSGNIIGGNSSLERNILSGNVTSGIFMTGGSSTGNSIKGNYLGPSSSLTAIAGSVQSYGIFFQSGASNNIIGNIVAGEENQIAFNSAQGIRFFSLTTTGNKISGNPIYTNTGKPINLNYGASQANNGKAAPVITSTCLNLLQGTSGPNDVIEVFKNTTGNVNDATTFVGTATANGSGNWSLAVALAPTDYVIANATDASNNTSEFSAFAVNGGAGTWTWLGLSNSWFDACNWDKKRLPNSLSDVLIPNTGTNPFISGDHAACKTIQIQSTLGARLNINSSGGWKLNITP